MEGNKIAKLDLANCKYIMELHQRIKETFLLPDYYGCNWSAFHDMLRSEVDVQHIEIYGEHTLPAEWHKQIASMHEVLLCVKEERAQIGEPFDFVVID